MLRRARRWLLLALIAGGFGFTGLLPNTKMIAQGVFYASAAFAVLSLLFGLFEETEPVLHKTPASQANVIPLPTMTEPVQPEARAA